MPNKSNPLRAAAVLAASLLILPSLARAQSAAETIGQAPTATARQLDVTVDWVDIPDTDVSVTNVGLGPNHDGRLMAALIQNGAVDTRGPRVRTTDGVFGSVHVRTDMPTTVVVGGKAQKTVLHLDTFVEAMPRLIGGGTVSVTGGVQRAGLVPGVSPPAASTDFVTISSNVRDGEPSLLGGSGSDSGFGGSDRKHFVFITVTTVPERTAARK